MAAFKKPSLAGHGLLGTKNRPNVSPGELGFSAVGGGNHSFLSKDAHVMSEDNFRLGLSVES